MNESKTSLSDLDYKLIRERCSKDLEADLGGFMTNGDVIAMLDEINRLRGLRSFSKAIATKVQRMSDVPKRKLDTLSPRCIGECPVCGGLIYEDQPRRSINVLSALWLLHSDCTKALRAALDFDATVPRLGDK